MQCLQTGIISITNDGCIVLWENTAKQCRLGLFQDSDFAGDLEDSKFTSGGTLCIFGSHTFVPRSWMCNKQTSVSHSSTESEIIPLDAGLRLDGIPALDLWDLIVTVLHGNAHQSNQVRRGGSSAVLLQSGQDEKWWADSMECNCYLRNNQDLLSDGKTPYERRFGKPFNGPVIPSGAMVEYRPISARGLSRLHQFGPKVLPGKSPGYVLSVERIWKGEIMVADIEELEETDASEIHARRLNANEVSTPNER